MTFAPSTQYFAAAVSLFVLAACAGQPRKWGAPAKSAPPATETEATSSTPSTTKNTTRTTGAVVEKPGLPTPCENAACIDVCERAKEAEACREAGYALRDGSGVATDFVRAAKFFDRACQKKDRKSCHELAKATAVGEGVKTDPEKAITLYTTACELGAGQACDDLAKLHEKGELVPRDHAKAIDLLARGCTAEDFQLWTCTALRKAVDKKDKDAQRVVAGWKKACGTKDVTACRGLDRAGMGPKAAKSAK